MQERFFDQLYTGDIFDPDSKITINPINFEGFYPQTFEGGRLVILRDKYHLSPIIYSDNDTVTHYFAFIDGKFRVMR